MCIRAAMFRGDPHCGHVTGRGSVLGHGNSNASLKAGTVLRSQFPALRRSAPSLHFKCLVVLTGRRSTYSILGLVRIDALLPPRFGLAEMPAGAAPLLRGQVDQRNNLVLTRPLLEQGLESSQSSLHAAPPPTAASSLTSPLIPDDSFPSLGSGHVREPALEGGCGRPTVGRTKRKWRSPYGLRHSCSSTTRCRPRSSAQQLHRSVLPLVSNARVARACAHPQRPPGQDEVLLSEYLATHQHAEGRDRTNVYMCHLDHLL